jgi:hypothetical protein
MTTKELLAEIKRLREIEHAAWHLLDDSEDRDTEAVIPKNHHYRRLHRLLPEDHP